MAKMWVLLKQAKGEEVVERERLRVGCVCVSVLRKSKRSGQLGI